MARNEEKAQSMLNRFLELKRGNVELKPEKRPRVTGTVESIPECERWRRQVMKEIGDKVSVIQNASLGEHRIRELNDEINKLLREKRAWEYRIVELNGPDYSKSKTRLFAEDGVTVAGGKGYKYFGAAKELPGVKELLVKPEAKKPKRTRYDMYKNIRPDYYGFRDDDDGVLQHLESRAEKRAINESIEEWREWKEKKSGHKGIDAGAVKAGEDPMAQDLGITEEEVEGYMHVPVPTQEDIEQFMLEERKKKLISQI
eukprot:gb/GECH01001828.1/.p1 GENE.gb/GECH01001828.1/~~gb/GECH01001828.1/.p1  ORF type:complete len:257 (+),score=77.26 gb/GECH01001828.1/:1-771(+)